MPTYKDYPLNGIDYEYEQFESWLITTLMAPRQPVQALDLGANSGHFTMLMALYAGAGGRVISVEADPALAQRCRHNVWANGLRNVDLLCAACGTPGTRRFYVDNGCGGDGRLKQYAGEDRNSILVPCLGLDELVGLLPNRRVDVVKIDVQGAEIEILDSGRESLGHNPDLIMLVEYSPHDLEGFGHVPRMLTDRLHQSGFQVLILNNQSRRLLYLPPGKAIRRGTTGDKGVLNLLCLRGKYAEQIPDWMKPLFTHIDPAQLEG